MSSEYLIAQKGQLLTQSNGSAFFADYAALAQYRTAALAQLPLMDKVGPQLLIMPDALETELEPVNLRAALEQTNDDAEYALLARAAQLATWYMNHRFCGRCGTELEPHAQDLAQACPSCNLAQYPRISPCIIVLVMDGDRCLLAHSGRLQYGRYSTLAGFIEAGESAEQAVHREIKEEVGIEVKNVRYFSSQSWPFPHALMLGYFADYAGGEVTPDEVEITEAKWFTRDTLPEYPPNYSIAGQLIDAFANGEV